MMGGELRPGYAAARAHAIGIQGNSAYESAPLRARCPRRQRPEYKPESYPGVSAVVACYLPNEVSIIEATLNHVLRLEYPGKVTVWCVYIRGSFSKLPLTLQSALLL